MKLFLYLILFMSISGILVAASLPVSPVADHQQLSSAPHNVLSFPKSRPVHSKKQSGFFKRLGMMRQVVKAMRHGSVQSAGLDQADKKAQDSLWIGILALACALIPWYTIFIAIPLGILAITFGSQAKRMGSQKITGKGFGIAALVIVAVWVLLVAAFVIGYTTAWANIFG